MASTGALLDFLDLLDLFQVSVAWLGFLYSSFPVKEVKEVKESKAPPGLEAHDLHKTIDGEVKSKAGGLTFSPATTIETSPKRQ